MTLVDTIEAALSGRVIVFGSLPPAGRDLDLLARPVQERQIASALSAQGFARSGAQWVRLQGCSGKSVDLVPAANWALPARELSALFSEAQQLGGLDHLVRPAPHHLLLILARRVVQGHRQLDDKLTTLIEQALHEDSGAWDRAADRASSWSASRSLSTLEHAYRTGMHITPVQRIPAMNERSAVPGPYPLIASLRSLRAAGSRRSGAGTGVVALSGLDGSGKTSQAEALRDTLRDLGVDAVVVWAKLARNPSLDLLARPMKSLFSRVPTIRSASGAGDRKQPARDIGKELRRASPGLTQLWSTVVAVANGLTQRRTTRYHLSRGRIVIRDRYTLDSIVRLRYRYGENRRFGFQAWLIKLISPKPLLAYFLDVPADVALTRKAEQYDLDQLRRQAELYRQEHTALGIKRLTGDRPKHELCELIAREVWEKLASHA
jgi:thymidylate kinase